MPAIGFAAAVGITVAPVVSGTVNIAVGIIGISIVAIAFFAAVYALSPLPLL